MLNDFSGYPLVAGEPEHTEDDRFWDGTRLYRCTGVDVRRGRVAQLLRQADVVVENRDDCTPGHPRLGTKTVLDARARAQLAAAGFVRFAGGQGEVQRWEAQDGTVLALLVGQVTRPRQEWGITGRPPAGPSWPGPALLHVPLSRAG